MAACKCYVKIFLYRYIIRPDEILIRPGDIVIRPDELVYRPDELHVVYCPDDIFFSSQGTYGPP